ncbi:MAG: hypothetical protein AAF589_06605 [Planctomycetota bacterium]
MPAGLLATFLMLTMAVSASGADAVVTTGWASTAAQSKSVEKATTKGSQATKASPKWRVAGSSKASKPGRAATALARRDARVKPVGYDDDFAGKPRGEARMESIALRDSGGPAFHLAQSDEPDFGSELEKALADPIGVEELPPKPDGMLEPGDPLTDGPDPFDAPSLPEIDSPLPDLDMSDESTQTLPPLDEEPAMNDPTMSVPDEGLLPPPDLGTGDGELTPLPDPLDGDLIDDFSPADGSEDGAGADRWTKQQAESVKDCAEELAALKANRLSMIDIRIGLEGQEGKDYPFNCTVDDGTPFTPRAWSEVTYMWKASALCHKPLYFEQTHLERYGHSWGPYLDPIVSGAHFFTRLPALPYCMGLKAPTECVYTLGYYRPGNCAPYLIEQPGFTCRAATLGLGAWTGGVFLVP